MTIAARLANEFGAKLIGVTTSIFLHPAATQSEREVAARLMEAAGERFLAASAEVRAGASLIEGAGSPGEALAALSWAADLIVVDHPESVIDRFTSDELRALVVGTNVPVLVLSRGRPMEALNHVVVVWDGLAACARAAASSLPLLGRAKTITVLAPPWREVNVELEQSLNDFRQGLGARGIDSRLTRLDDLGPSELTLEHAQSLSPDLIVMGAWPQRQFWGPKPLVGAFSPGLTTPALVRH